MQVRFNENVWNNTKTSIENRNLGNIVWSWTFQSFNWNRPLTIKQFSPLNRDCYVLDVTPWIVAPRSKTRMCCVGVLILHMLFTKQDLGHSYSQVLCRCASKTSDYARIFQNVWIALASTILMRTSRAEMRSFLYEEQSYGCAICAFLSRTVFEIKVFICARPRGSQCNPQCICFEADWKDVHTHTGRSDENCAPIGGIVRVGRRVHR